MAPKSAKPLFDSVDILKDPLGKQIQEVSCHVTEELLKRIVTGKDAQMVALVALCDQHPSFAQFARKKHLEEQVATLKKKLSDLKEENRNYLSKQKAAAKELEDTHNSISV